MANYVLGSTSSSKYSSTLPSLEFPCWNPFSVSHLNLTPLPIHTLLPVEEIKRGGEGGHEKLAISFLAEAKRYVGENRPPTQRPKIIMQLFVLPVDLPSAKLGLLHPGASGLN